MFLKNYDLLLYITSGYTDGYGPISSSSAYGLFSSLIDIDGNSIDYRNIDFFRRNYYYPGITSSVSNGGNPFSTPFILFGSGSTSPKWKDYKLENCPFISEHSNIFINYTLVSPVIDSNGVKVITTNYTYKGEDPLTIKEIGVFCLKLSSTASPYEIITGECNFIDRTGVLFTRSILPTEKIILPNETFTLTVKLGGVTE